MQPEESFINDAFMADTLEKLPGEWVIEYGEIKKFRDMEDFIILDFDAAEHLIEYNNNICMAYNYYYEIWENSHEFGLPNGGDWNKNPAWIIRLVKVFNMVFAQIENYRRKKAE